MSEKNEKKEAGGGGLPLQTVTFVLAHEFGGGAETFLQPGRKGVERIWAQGQWVLFQIAGEEKPRMVPLAGVKEAVPA